MAKKEQPPIYCVRRGNALVPEMALDADLIEALPSGQRIKVTITEGRSPSRLRWYFAFLGKVVKATECASNVEALHSLIKLETGHTTPVKFKGYTVLVPASVSFISMSESDFSAFCESAVKFVAETFGVTPEEVFGE